MNFSADDVASILVQGLIGGTIAVGYSIYNLYAQRQSGALLESMQTDALHVDRKLLSYCRELERRIQKGPQKDSCQPYFLQAMHSIDNILKIRFRLSAKKEPATKTDEDVAFSFLTNAGESLKLLKKECEIHMSPQKFNDLETLVKRMMENAVEPHIKAISKLTSNAQS